MDHLPLYIKLYHVRLNTYSQYESVYVLYEIVTFVFSLPPSSYTNDSFEAYCIG